jgi:O-antigen/teichoic acid export membrane protein
MAWFGKRFPTVSNVQAQWLDFRHGFKDRFFRQLFRNVGILLRGDVFSSLLGFASLALTSRTLGPQLFGVLALAQTYAQVIDRLCNFQSWQALIKFGAEALERRDSEDFKRMVKLSSMLDAAGALTGTTVALLLAPTCGGWFHWDDQTVRLATAYSFVILFAASGTPTAILRLLDRFQLFAAQRVFFEGLRLTAVAVAFSQDAQLPVYVGIWMAADVFKHVFLLVSAHTVLWRTGMRAWWRSPLGRWRSLVAFNGWSNLASTLDLPVKQLDLFIISAVVSAQAVGVFRVFKQVAQVLSKVADPIYYALYPQFARLIAQAQGTQASRTAARLGVLLGALAFPLVALMALSSPWWLGTIFGQAYAADWAVLSVYLGIQAFALCFQGIHPLFLALGYVRMNCWILAAANASFVLIAWLLGARIGLLGVVVAYGVQSAIAAAGKTTVVWARTRAAC